MKLNFYERVSKRERKRESERISCHMSNDFAIFMTKIANMFKLTHHKSLFMFLSVLFSSSKMLFYSDIFASDNDGMTQKQSFFCYIINVIYWSNFLLLFSSFFFCSFNLVMIIIFFCCLRWNSSIVRRLNLFSAYKLTFSSTYKSINWFLCSLYDTLNFVGIYNIEKRMWRTIEVFLKLCSTQR